MRFRKFLKLSQHWSTRGLIACTSSSLKPCCIVTYLLRCFVKIFLRKVYSISPVRYYFLVYFICVFTFPHIRYVLRMSVMSSKTFIVWILNMKIIKVIFVLFITYSFVLGDKSILYSSGTLLRVLECIMTISFGVCLVVWLFGLGVFCNII
jgi:hypothetical protein